MSDSLPFHHQPDPVLGDALRQALDPGDSTAFVARVLARAPQIGPGSWDAVLARWARVGVIAAALVALLAGYAVGSGATGTAVARPTVADALLAPSRQAPEAELVLASVLGN
ncbi:MAG TPA: hypothetical protein VEU55_06715 [Gemmatimonadales bacterium]|nr:hypothetical protein [Gemmatimonadales bacterium]